MRYGVQATTLLIDSKNNLNHFENNYVDGFEMFPKLENIFKIWVLVHEFIQCIVIHHVMPQDLQRIICIWGTTLWGE